jgi:hypothetical protein
MMLSVHSWDFGFCEFDSSPLPKLACPVIGTDGGDQCYNECCKGSHEPARKFLRYRERVRDKSSAMVAEPTLKGAVSPMTAAVP